MFGSKDDDDERGSVPPEDRPLHLSAALLGFALSFALSLLLFRFAATDLVSGVACQAAAYLGCTFLVLRVHASRRRLSHALAVRATNPSFYGLAVGLGVALQLFAEVVQRGIETLWPMPLELRRAHLEALKMDGPILQIVVPLAAVGLGPIVEEVFFRGALQGGLRRVYRPAPVVLVVSLLFAFAHGSPHLFVSLFLIGVVLALLRTATGSLIPAIITHITFNAVAVVGIMAGWASVEMTPLPLATSLAGILGTVVLLAAVLYVAKHSRRAEHARKEDLA